MQKEDQNKADEFFLRKVYNTKQVIKRLTRNALNHRSSGSLVLDQVTLDGSQPKNSRENSPLGRQSKVESQVPDPSQQDLLMKKQVSIVNMIMIAKSKFMAVVKRNRASKLKQSYKITRKRMKSIEEWQKERIDHKN